MQSGDTLQGLLQSISSIRGELIPYLVRKQFSSPVQPEQNKEEEDPDQKKKEPKPLDIYSFMRNDDLLSLAQEKSCWNDHRGDMTEAYHGTKLRCYIHIMEKGLHYRVNTLALYIEANRQIPKLLSTLCPEEQLVHTSAQITDSYLVGSDSIVRASSQVAEKTSIKRSMLISVCNLYYTPRKLLLMGAQDSGYWMATYSLPLAEGRGDRANGVIRLLFRLYTAEVQNSELRLKLLSGNLYLCLLRTAR
nr:PREDICTED: translation initiation factor eIF-2B subunit gamma-like [Latimeria chalumnae]|eukprot:XP_014353115.1 PREDICTED: translation initiation factor eIF-2B subunit gamma-like [Latimeria chalumnae]